MRPYLIILSACLLFLPTIAQAKERGTHQEALLTLLEEPEHHFYEAHKYMLAHKPEAAAREIRLGAAYLELTASDPIDEQDRLALLDANERMHRLADDVEKKWTDSAPELDPTFSQAYLALSTHYHREAWMAWNNREVEKMGQYLNASVHYFERNLAGAKYKLNAAAQKTLDETHLLAAQLTINAGKISAQTGHKLEAFGKELEKAKADAAKKQ